MPERFGYIQFRISDVNRAGLERLKARYPDLSLTAIGDKALTLGIQTLEKEVSAAAKIVVAATDALMALNVPPEIAATFAAAGAAAQAAPVLSARKVHKIFLDMGRRTPAGAAKVSGKESGISDKMDADPGLPAGP
jgi:hypothetical protein